MFAEVGKSFRTSAYCLEDGFIKPLESSEVVEFDLWSAYAANSRSGWTIEVPYREALELGRSLRVVPPKWPEDGTYALVLLPAQSAEVLKFCSRFGLLGLLPTQAERITLRATTAQQGMPAVEYRKNLGSWIPAYASPNCPGVEAIEWAETTWDSQGKFSGAGREFTLPGDFMPDLKCWHFEEESLATMAQCFFPQVPLQEVERFHYPKPGAAAFFGVYCEPVYLFVMMLSRFLASVEMLSGPGGEQASDADAKWRALDFLQQLASQDHSFLVPQNDGINVERHHHTPGLIAALAAMFLRDWERGRRVVYCETCGTVFVTEDSRAKYCTETCRKTMLMRRYRNAKKSSTSERRR